jgi:ELWxxDGT repeat protein
VLTCFSQIENLKSLINCLYCHLSVSRVLLQQGALVIGGSDRFLRKANVALHFHSRSRERRLTPTSRVDSRLHCEVLEDRRLLSATPQLLKDINPAGHSDPILFFDVSGTVFFRANDGTTGGELWKSAGTTATTTLVKDIRPSTGAGVGGGFVNLNGTLLFIGNDGNAGYELWKSDGTQSGTVLVKEIRPGTSSSVPQGGVNINGTVFFKATDGTNGYELWKTDGTETGTVLVKDISPGSFQSSPSFLTNLNGTLFFQAVDTSAGLWKSDGTTAGTVLVKQISPEAVVTAALLTNLNGTLFFTANDGTHGSELWKSDGTTEGTVLVKDINPGGGTFGSSYPSRLIVVNQTLFFSATDGQHGRELWKSDGTEAGTVLVKDINPGSSLGFDRYVANVNGTLFFQGTDGTHGTELWKSDGTADGTVLVRDINPGSSSSTPRYLINANGTVFFQANDGSTGIELWRSDGTESGTAVHDINPGSASSSPKNLATSNGTLYLLADDGTVGREPWIVPASSTIAATALFYKGSTKWNVTNGATFSDDNAIATDKTAYLPGSGTSTFAAVSSYDKGINGIMVDLRGPHGAITVNDFTFKRGNNNSPNAWVAATAPTAVTTRAGAGVTSSDRIELLWNDNDAVKKQWLEVIVEGNDTLGGFNTNTGLAQSYVFFFGNPLGDSGTGNSGAFQVTSTDEINARNNPKTFTATRSDVNDFNRDGSVTSTDQIIARNNGTNLGNQLKFLVVGAGGPFAPELSDASGSGEPIGTSSPSSPDRGISSALATRASIVAPGGGLTQNSWVAPPPTDVLLTKDVSNARLPAAQAIDQLHELILLELDLESESFDVLLRGLDD